MAPAPNRDALADLLATIEEHSARVIDREASGYVVVVIDTEPDPELVVSVYGPCALPETALILAGKFDADPHSGAHPADGSPGWKHVVVPLYPPDSYFKGGV